MNFDLLDLVSLLLAKSHLATAFSIRNFILPNCINYISFYTYALVEILLMTARICREKMQFEIIVSLVEGNDGPSKPDNTSATTWWRHLNTPVLEERRLGGISLFK